MVFMLLWHLPAYPGDKLVHTTAGLVQDFFNAISFEKELFHYLKHWYYPCIYNTDTWFSTQYLHDTYDTYTFIIFNTYITIQLH